MAPKRNVGGGDVSLRSIESSLRSSVAAERLRATEDLLFYFTRVERRSQPSQSLKGDDNYHNIFEALFQCTMLEKQNYFSAKKGSKASSGTRLENCAKALKAVVFHGGHKIKRKTARALVDHITQVLPGPDDEFVAPLLQDYTRAFLALLNHPANVENFAVLDGEVWLSCVDFCILAVSRFLDNGEGASNSLGRSSPAPGTAQTLSLAFSTGRSSSSSGRRAGTQQSTGQIRSSVATDYLSCLNTLLSTPHAPVLERAKEVSQLTLHILHIRHAKQSSLYQVAFACINSILAQISADDIALGKSITREVLPLIGHCWPARAILRDAMSNTIREEILKTLYSVHQFLDSLTREPSADFLLRDVEELLDILWSEYSKREDRSRLMLDDITFAALNLPEDHPRTRIFSLRPYTPTAEQNWTLMEILSVLETLHIRNSKRNQPQQTTEGDDQPRKRRRMAGDLTGVLKKVTSLDPGVRLTALQLLPFVLQKRRLTAEEVAEVLDTLSSSISGKEPLVASWAMLACASIVVQESGQMNTLSSIWKQVWQIGVRSVSLAGTSRAACVLLHCMLEADILPKHEIMDDISLIITNSDISGPALVVDSSLVLMLHLLAVRNMASPNASQATSSHIIRWVFSKWNPDDLIYASLHSHLATPLDLSNLMRACCGMPNLDNMDTALLFAGPIGQFRQSHQELRPMLRYLLLLEDGEIDDSDLQSQRCMVQIDSSHSSDPTTSHTSKRLILELIFPKMEQLLQLADSWSKKGEGATQVSTDRLQSVIHGALTSILLLPELLELNSTMSRDVEPLIFGLVDSCTKAILDSEHNDSYFDLLLTSAAPYLPVVGTSDLRALKDQNRHLLGFFAKVSECLQERSRRELSGQRVDLMDVDDDFPESQASSQKSSASNISGLPRRDISLSRTPEAFYTEMKLRLRLLEIIHQDDGQVGLVPEAFLDDLLALSTEQLLCCRRFMQQLLSSDLITTLDDATRIIETLGLIISSKDFSYCEAALCLILEVMEALMSLWIDDKLEIASMVGDLYNHFVKYALPKNELSPAAQSSLCDILFGLLAVRPDYAASLKLPSCRSTLFSMLRDGSMRVKYVIGTNTPKIFSMFVLKAHDEIFVDILDNLPSDPKATEGIAFRLYVLAELACSWSTLLRRSVYHIFETPGRIEDSSKYATSCVRRISRSLSLKAPRELFNLFAPQLLYTWLHNDPLEKIPFEIFGFSQLHELLAQAQTEVAAMLMMFGKEDEVLDLAQELGMTPQKLIEECFTKIMAYGIAHDSSHASVPSTPVKSTCESRVRKLLGKEVYYECIHLNFADIVATVFDIFDQEDPVEKYFRRDANGIYEYAADIMDTIKELGCLDTVLPPNQQPMFKAKYLTRELAHLCSRTEYEVQMLWTPSLVVAVARKLLNTVHPAFGPLHACSVIRKIRVLISMAGSQALASYPLEMLLHSTRMFLKDPECADDALGVARYLIQNGGHHLKQAPSFLAGYALSSLADLRVFLESSQSSTTQESQFKATISKAQVFHTWFARYLTNYDSPAFKDDEQRQAFKSITQSAAHIRASGNAEKGTPESNLLLEILKDDEKESQLLNGPAREVAMDMLCGVFTIPQSSRTDVIETDEEALDRGAIVLKSCRSQKLSDDYLAWGGRVVGRSFLASGEIPLELLQESRLPEYRKLSSDNSGSEHGILNIIEALTVSSDCITAGLAESALRTIVSESYLTEDQDLIVACQKSLSESLLASSNWEQYRTPPSDYRGIDQVGDRETMDVKLLEDTMWPQRLAIYLAQSNPDMVILRVLPPILANVKGCAERAFPFILHLVLLSELDKPQGMKRQLSEALREWLKSNSEAATENLKLLLNTILYLRTQRLPNETSIVDRCHWLEVNFSAAAEAATRCGMFKAAVLFAELASSEISRSSRRSSALREAEDPTEILLNIFENIDDPDAYYGLTQDASLATVLARLEYENDGSKSLAFRGAQYDSHLRRRDPTSQQDGQLLIKALSSLGLAGLSHSLLESQQSLVTSPTSLDSTFTTARRLEVWNLPAPASRDNYAVNLYKAYQTMHKADDIAVVRDAIHDGLKHTIGLLSSSNLTAFNLRHHLGALAALTELDDLTNVTEPSELEAMLKSFSTRSKWMMSGRYGDVSQILSCRETSLSILSQQHRLRPPKVQMSDVRLTQIRGMLLSSDIYRFHQATQESLNLSTSLTDLIKPSEEMGLVVDASVRIEAANSLWDHGEMISSIRMLQNIDKDSSLKKQTVPVSRSNLLSKTGHWVSVARLESPDNIQKRYLEPALKELKGKSEGKEAGQVYHQFAMFCDEQLQNPDSLEDLARLQNLKKGKSDEVADLKSLMSTASSTQLKQRYASYLAKAKQWLELDQQELRRVEQTRSEFVRLSLENYLLSLVCSDENNNDALRFTALWLERSDEDTTNEAVRKYLERVPTRKFAPLMNQLSSRLQQQNTVFQSLLFHLVLRICIDHPFHGMYQVWSGAKAKSNSSDATAVSRHEATKRLAGYLVKHKRVSEIWSAISATSRAYHDLALERDPNQYKAGQKMPIKSSPRGMALINSLSKNLIPPPTMQIELSSTMDYSHIPVIQKLEPNMSIASGVSAPKIITAIGSDGKKYKQLVKGGNDDLRQDAIMEQVFAAVSELLKLHRTTRQRNLGIRTYKVLPLTASSGLIEFVSDTIPLHEYLMPAHEQYYPKDLKGSQCRKEISNVQTKSVDTRIAVYRKVTERFHPVMRYFFMENFVDPDEWFVRRTAYTRSTAAISILGHVLGLGDRHGHNILLDTSTGEAVHIDLGVAFEMGRILPVPELVPFRMTRDIVDGMGITKTEGVFRRCCEFTLDALREETYSIMTILDVLRYDPLYSWSISPLRMAKLQNATRGNEEGDVGGTGEGESEAGDGGGGKKGGVTNEPSEADRALEVVKKKLSKTLSVTATVNDLINQATDERNLAVLYSGWAAYA